MADSPKLSSTDKALQKVADLIIERMEALKAEQWQKPWFSNAYQGIAKNLSGRAYGGMNSLILDLYTSKNAHEVPVFLTFNQAKKEGLHINKGAKSIPVFYLEVSFKDEKGKSYTPEEYSDMTQIEKEGLSRRFFVRKYDVFNVSDTNLREVKPEVFADLLKAYAVKKLPDAQGMYSNPALDRMFKEQEWLCPIEQKPGDQAYYRPSTDSITIPFKAQFKQGTTEDEIYRSGMRFYSTAIHEMAHSTGTPERLDRETGKKFGDKKYAKEELVAELTAATVCQQLGFDKRITDNSAKYLDNWLQALKEEPKFLYTVLSEVGKAQGLIMDEIEKQKQQLKQNLPEASPAMLLNSSHSEACRHQYPDTLILVRHQNHYELYNDDAVHASKTLEIPLSKYQQEGKSEPLQVVSFDKEKLDTHLPQLVRAGHKIAIVETKVSEAQLIKNKEGDYFVRAMVQGNDTGLIPMDKATIAQYLKMDDPIGKQALLNNVVLSNYTPSVSQSSLSHGHKL